MTFIGQIVLAERVYTSPVRGLVKFSLSFFLRINVLPFQKVNKIVCLSNYTVVRKIFRRL